MPARHGRSLTEDVYAAIRSDILHGRLAPDERLQLRPTAERLGVSLGVVREAATRLAGERLLTATPQTGFRVPALSIRQLEELTWVRCHVESLAIREAIAHGGPDWEASLVGALHRLTITPSSVDGGVSDVWMGIHRDFHAALAEGCPNRTLLAVRQQLFDEAELYRHWSARAAGPARDLHGEHRRLVDAALHRDADLAVRLVHDHLTHTADRIANATPPALTPD